MAKKTLSLSTLKRIYKTLRINIWIKLANKPIFLIATLFALITSMVTVALLSSYSMDIEKAVYGSAIPQQGEESTGEVQNNSSILDNSSIGNELPVINSN